MKKTCLLLVSTLALVGCASGEGGNGNSKKADATAQNYFKAFESAEKISAESDKTMVKTTGNGIGLVGGVKANDANDTYYHVTGKSILFTAAVDATNGKKAENSQAEFLLQGGSLKLDTNSADVSSVKDYLSFSDLKLKSYWNDGTFYLKANENALIGVAIQTAVRQISGDSSYRLYGGGNTLSSKDRYRGKVTFSEEDNKKIDDALSSVDGDGIDSFVSATYEVMNNAYQGSDGGKGFTFTPLDGKLKKISFSTTDDEVLKGAFSGVAEHYLPEQESDSIPSASEAEEDFGKFLDATETQSFKLEAYFNDKGVTQLSSDISFSVDETKMKEQFPEGIYSQDGVSYWLDGTLSAKGSLLFSYGDAAAFTLPNGSDDFNGDNLSDYQEFPAPKKQESSGADETTSA